MQSVVASLMCLKKNDSKQSKQINKEASIDRLVRMENKLLNMFPYSGISWDLLMK